MLDDYFKYPGGLRRMRRGPLGDQIDAIAPALLRTGYTRLSARRYLSVLASFSATPSDAAARVWRPSIPHSSSGSCVDACGLPAPRRSPARPWASPCAISVCSRARSQCRRRPGATPCCWRVVMGTFATFAGSKPSHGKNCSAQPRAQWPGTDRPSLTARCTTSRPRTSSGTPFMPRTGEPRTVHDPPPCRTCGTSSGDRPAREHRPALRGGRALGSPRCGSGTRHPPHSTHEVSEASSRAPPSDHT